MKFTQALAGLFSVVALLLAGLAITVGITASAAGAQDASCIIGDAVVLTDLTQNDCDALVTFHAATDGANWTDSMEWVTATDPCTWHGVMCSVTEAGHVGVTELNLSWNAVSGQLPAEIGDLTDLHTLILQGNALTGPIPAEIGQLAGLQFLALSGNPLGGPLPAELWTLDQLQMLVVEDAGLTGGLSASVVGLTELSVLVLSGNELTGEIPAELAQLDLVYLDLSNNNLTGEVPLSLSAKVATGELLIEGNAALVIAEPDPVSPDVAIESTCLGPNGRIDVAVSNSTTTAAGYAVTVGALTPRGLALGAGEDGRFAVTGRADGPLLVTVARDGVEIHAEEVTVACDPVVEVFVHVTCTDGNGRVDTTITNLTGADATYAVTIGSLAPRTTDLAAGEGNNIAATGRADGPIDVIVTRDGQTISTSTHQVACD